MDTVHINRSNDKYPGTLHLLENRAPDRIAALGSLDLLTAKALALFCSVKCPGSLILQTYDLIQKLRQTSVTIVSGFHSPVERECLTVLLRSENPIIICPARGIESMRIPSEYKRSLEKGRLLLLSPFTENQRRATAQMAFYRNQFVAALAEQIFVAYAEPSGKTEQFCRRILEWQKPFYTFESEANRNLIAMGAKPINENYKFDQPM